ncbi:hypothetical protein [Eikenella corrodens]|uniref:hypothetical protein n=1 Tax=Eikenella corrodens TaxID=539 RepID=UPI000A4C8187|nr:hypothetical protein [Eikenella corrodens]
MKNYSTEPRIKCAQKSPAHQAGGAEQSREDTHPFRMGQSNPNSTRRPHSSA